MSELLEILFDLLVTSVEYVFVLAAQMFGFSFNVNKWWAFWLDVFMLKAI